MPHSHLMPEAPLPVWLGAQPRILVIKLATPGDLLLATPTLRALRQRYAAARLDVLTTASSAQLLRESPLVDHVYTLDKYAFDAPSAIVRKPWQLARTLPLIATLRRNQYSAVLLLHHLTLTYGQMKYRGLLAAIHARCTVGLDNGHGDFLDLRVPDLGFGDRHEAEYALAIAAAVGATLPRGESDPRFADLGWGKITAQPQMAPPLVAMHPGSGAYSVARRWPADRFAELAAALHDEYGAHVVLVGDSSERELHERILARLLAGRSTHARSAPDWIVSEAGRHTPRQLAQRFAECAVFIGNDSFPMHLATAVGVPVVAIFGPSNARAWGPYTPDNPHRAVVIRRDDVPCSPCFYRGHALGTPQGCPARPCLTELGIQPVLRAARHLLRQPLAGAAPAG